MVVATIHAAATHAGPNDAAVGHRCCSHSFGHDLPPACHDNRPSSCFYQWHV